MLKEKQGTLHLIIKFAHILLLFEIIQNRNWRNKPKGGALHVNQAKWKSTEEASWRVTIQVTQQLGGADANFKLN